MVSFILFITEVSVSAVVNSNHAKRYNDTALITKLEKLRKQYETLKQEFENSSIMFMNNSVGKVSNEEVGEGKGLCERTEDKREKCHEIIINYVCILYLKINSYKQSTLASSTRVGFQPGVE